MARKRWRNYVAAMEDPRLFGAAAPDLDTIKPLAQIMWDRRATRHFTSEPMPDEQLEEILALASQAPSGYNLQPWRFVVVRKAELRQRLRAAAFDQAKVSEAPVVVVAFARRSAWDEWSRQIFEQAADSGARQRDDLRRQRQEALSFISKLPIEVWLNRHVMIAFTYLMLAAESLGWDTAPMEGFDPAAVRETLDLPDDAEVVALLAIGRQSGQASPHPGRLPVEKLVYRERFGEPWHSDA
jgi:nitroreductase